MRARRKLQRKNVAWRRFFSRSRRAHPIAERVAGTNPDARSTPRWASPTRCRCHLTVRSCVLAESRSQNKSRSSRGRLVESLQVRSALDRRTSHAAWRGTTSTKPTSAGLQVSGIARDVHSTLIIPPREPWTIAQPGSPSLTRLCAVGIYSQRLTTIQTARHALPFHQKIWAVAPGLSQSLLPPPARHLRVMAADQHLGHCPAPVVGRA